VIPAASFLNFFKKGGHLTCRVNDFGEAAAYKSGAWIFTEESNSLYKSPAKAAGKTTSFNSLSAFQLLDVSGFSSQTSDILLVRARLCNFGHLSASCWNHRLTVVN
jgi:hypothetical protein